MKPQIATTIEQSRRLLACGVDPNTADMSVRTIKEPYGDDMAWHIPKLLTLPYDEAKTIYGEYEITPAWSLSALLALLPKEIYDSNDDSYYFSLAKEFPLSYEYGAAYMPCWVKGESIIRTRDNSPIEACVQMIEWLIANEYKINRIEE